MTLRFNTHSEARAAFEVDRPMHELNGIILHGAMAYVSEDVRRNIALAMDAAIPAMQTDPNSSVPAMLTTLIDPQVYEILFAPNKAALILGEQKKGTWLDDTAMFPVVEHTGEVSSYGDRNNNGRAGANTNWPQRQQYLYQTIVDYGERELERAGLAKINWVGELNKAAATVLNKFSNLSYFFGVAGLQNYGLLNDPGLPAAITPATKAQGGVTWFVNGATNASANEVYNDIVSLFADLVGRNQGLVDKDARMVLAMSPESSVALTFTNSFNVNVEDLLKKNFKNLRIETAPQYGEKTTENPQGVTGGNFVQLIAEEVEGQQTGYCSFGEKLRSHPIIRQLSSFQQKMSGGTWGAIIRYQAGFAQMIGV